MYYLFSYSLTINNDTIRRVQWYSYIHVQPRPHFMNVICTTEAGYKCMRIIWNLLFCIITIIINQLLRAIFSLLTHTPYPIHTSVYTLLQTAVHKTTPNPQAGPLFQALHLHAHSLGPNFNLGGEASGNVSRVHSNVKHQYLVIT